MTRALILAAGRGERMRPLTDVTPKPLLQVQGKPLMQWPLEALARGGFFDVVVNTAWLGEVIVQTFGTSFLASGREIEAQTGNLPPANRHPLNLPLPNTQPPIPPPIATRITYSHEAHDFGGALETAGGVARVLSSLGDVFWVLAGDVFAPDFEFTQGAVDRFKRSGNLAHLWLVPNPDHNPGGDFGLSADGLALNWPKGSVAPMYTYSTVGLFHRDFFSSPFCSIPAGNPSGIKAPLLPLMRAGMDAGRVSAEIYLGRWTDVGTPERLQQLNQAA